MNKTLTNQRNSSVELFRILATFLVLIVHFNGWFIGGMPDKLTDFSIPSISQAFIESLSSVCVNCFLVITGWYGLKFKWSHVVTIWSILVWIYVPCYLVEVIYRDNFSCVTFLLKIIAFGQESYYVQCYLMLLFFSPVLNSFINKYSKRILYFSIAFWIIEISFDWVLKNKCLSFGHGYELTHFILMYMLGQTAFIYKEEIRKRLTSIKGIMIYILGAIIVTLLYIIIPGELAFAYSNPINIIMAFALFFAFERKNFFNNTINTIGKSTLSVYILNITPPVINILIQWDLYILHKYSYIIWLLVMLLTIIIVFFSGIIYDKIKSLFMTKTTMHITKWLDEKTEKYILQ